MTDTELKKLKSVMRKKQTSRTVCSRCQIIIDLDEANGKVLTHEQPAKTNCVCMTTITNAVKLFSESGIDGKTDSEYTRNGNCSIFAFVEALGGTHHASVHELRTAIDWAVQIKYLVDEMFSDAEKIILVLDNLNTHKPASLYKAFLPAEARWIIKRLEMHYTPKHGSRLNIAEIELNAMTRQCLARRINTLEHLQKELSAWEQQRNTNQKTGVIPWPDLKNIQ